MTYAILFIGVLLFLGHIFSSLFEKTRLPDVLPLMVLGMLMGPVLQIVSPESFGEAGQIFTTLALIVVLFKSGIDFRILSLRGAVGQGLLLTTVCFVLITAIIAFIAQRVLGIPQTYALIIGAIVADNSTAIITPMLAKLQVSKTAKTILFLEANLTGVYSIVLALALLSAASHGSHVSAGMLAADVLKSFGIGIVFALAAGFLDEHFKPGAAAGKRHFADVRFRTAGIQRKRAYRRGRRHRHAGFRRGGGEYPSD